MTSPSVSDFTAGVYGRLPEQYRTADEQQDWPLLRWLSLLGDQAGELQALFDRMASSSAHRSEITDPQTADAAWLPWLARIVGVDMRAVADVAQQRQLLASTDVVRLAGTTASIVAAVQATLVGVRTVDVATQVGDRWGIQVTVYAAETPDAAATTAAALRFKPAGMHLTVQVLPGATYAHMRDVHGPTVATFKSTFATYDAARQHTPEG